MTARWVERRTKGQVKIQPWQTFPARMVEAGLTAEDGRKQVWLVAPNGNVKGGAAAINGALNLIWWARPFTWLYSLPGLKQIEDVVYRWVARNRHRFPGITPACETDFDCHEGEKP